MWFKNLRLYRLLQPFSLTEQELHERLAERAFRPCGSQDLTSLGWVSPLGVSSEKLAHEVTGWVSICTRQEDKLLPAGVIKEILDEKVQTLEATEDRKIGRRERAELRDDIIHQLLPRALSKSTRVFAMIDRQNGWILVDSSSSNRAEALISLLRETLGSLRVRPIEVVMSPASVMTEWLQRPARYKDFVLLDSCELRDTDEEGGKVRCSGQDLVSDEIQAHLKAGKQVVKLAVAWDERISLVIEGDLAIKRMKFLDLIQEEVAELETDDDIVRFDATFSLMGLEFRRLIPRLVELFGGLNDVAAAH